MQMNTSFDGVSRVQVNERGHKLQQLAGVAFVLACLAAPASGGTPESLTTTFISNNGQAGNMFNVLATQKIQIVGLECSFDPGTFNVEVYTVPGGYAGNEANPGAWTLQASGSVVSNGYDLPTPLPFALDITVPSGTTLGFYVTSSSGSSMNYTDGLGTLPGTAASNNSLSISEGLGVAYPFSSTYSPRVWNGTVLYFSATGTPFCFGDGSGTICPCGNLAGSERGCANSGGLGVELIGDGSRSLAADTLTFAATDMPPGRPALLIAGGTDLNGGMGSLFGDGLRCVGGSTAALGMRFSNGSGDATWGPGLAALGGFQAGSTHYFQVIYRDTYASSPCSTYFNASNGVKLDYTP